MTVYYRLTKIILVLIIFSAAATVGCGYGGSSSSSGGMTTSNVDPYSNIAKYETVEKNLVYNKSIEYSFITPEFSIYQILVNGRENEFSIPVRMEDLKNTSKYAMRAPGIVYRNENVWLGSTRINYIGIKFKVKNSWIDDNTIDDGRLPYLLKWNGTVWLVLKTSMTGKDETYTYFESPKAGNSRIGIFAITLPNIMNRTANLSSQNTTSVDEYEYVIPDIEENGNNGNNGNNGKELPGFDVVIAIIGIALYLKIIVRL